MKKLLLASVLMLVTPAIATDISPVGCFAFLNKSKNPTSMRLNITKASKEDRKFWNWSFKLDVTLLGRRDVLRATGNCDDGRHSRDRRPLVARCYTEDGETRFLFTPHGADSEVFFTELRVKGPKGIETVSFGKRDTFKLEELDDWVCEKT